MSKNINVNPGQYKLRGRERQGEDINAPREKAELQKLKERGSRKKPGTNAKRKT
jgi:hypothetical protein